MGGGETDLDALLREMRPELGIDEYVFCRVTEEALAGLRVTPFCVVREAEGLTLVLERDAARAAGLEGHAPSRRITLTVRSSLEAVGFLAAVTSRLAARGIPVNAVSGFHHDHLLVPTHRANEAIRSLRALSATGR